MLGRQRGVVILYFGCDVFYLFEARVLWIGVETLNQSLKYLGQLWKRAVHHVKSLDFSLELAETIKPKNTLQTYFCADLTINNICCRPKEYSLRHMMWLISLQNWPESSFLSCGMTLNLARPHPSMLSHERDIVIWSQHVVMCYDWLWSNHAEL